MKQPILPSEQELRACAVALLLAPQRDLFFELLAPFTNNLFPLDKPVWDMAFMHEVGKRFDKADAKTLTNMQSLLVKAVSEVKEGMGNDPLKCTALEQTIKGLRSSDLPDFFIELANQLQFLGGHCVKWASQSD